MFGKPTYNEMDDLWRNTNALARHWQRPSLVGTLSAAWKDERRRLNRRLTNEETLALFARAIDAEFRDPDCFPPLWVQ